MQDSITIAMWEIKKMLKNKSFLLSIILTPFIMLLFAGVPRLLMHIESESLFTLYVVDEIGIYETLNTEMALDNLELNLYEGDFSQLEEKVKEGQDKGYMIMHPEVLNQGQVVIYTGGEGFPNLMEIENALGSVLKRQLLLDFGLTPESAQQVAEGFFIQTVNLTYTDDYWQRFTPVVFAGLMIFAVFITGMATMQSAMAEKKDRIVEVLLSTTSADSLMQGKIYGYFALGLIQVLVWLIFAIIAVNVIFEVPVHSYLLVPSFPIMLFFALGGYLLYSAFLVSMGATIDDLYTAGNFQGLVFMMPMLPILLIGPVVQNPNGTVALIGSYFPLTTPSIMLLRLALSNSLTVAGILLPALVLVVSIWLVTKISGKIFRTGILMYGKNATPQEILKWLRQ
ncbi:ABC transporter permease [Dethiobacter alkaliphilus]|uniref:ABC transporter permease n=1 Tax=Dethiobacter alkaliphilus TaxID=427926 RepID=UPI0022280C60|nr:ABC transporter permease [Dethiobacter alkaliphilus]MCW3489730.1 ABC transporter permease [Dethiobacter alkaliphilus]